MRPILIALAILLTGCATAANIKSGVVRGLGPAGTLKTTEGVALVTNGCSAAQVWRAALEGTRNSPVEILQADEEAGRIDARAAAGWSWANYFVFGVFAQSTDAYIGVFIQTLPPRTDLRLIEVSAFWNNRMSVDENPWEQRLLRAIVERLPCKIMASDEVIRDVPLPAFARPAGRPVSVEPSATTATSAHFCRQRANNIGGTRKDLWLAEYRRCMDGY